MPELSLPQLLNHAVNTLQTAGVDDPLTDAHLLAGAVLGVSRGRVQALAIMEHTLTEAEAERFERGVSERSQRIPLQHITGTAPFRSLELAVGPGVFVPRPETETVVQYAIDELSSDPRPNPLALDLCTGSGAIALAMATEVPQSRVWAIEQDPLAAAWARRNIDRLAEGRVTLVEGDIRDEHPELAHLRGGLTVICANPPYIPEAAIPRDVEVREHDPHEALFSGADGLDLIRSISDRYRSWLRPGGLLVLEHAETQGAAIRALLTGDGWTNAATFQDLTFRDRCTIARA